MDPAGISWDAAREISGPRVRARWRQEALIWVSRPLPAELNFERADAILGFFLYIVSYRVASDC